MSITHVVLIAIEMMCMKAKNSRMQIKYTVHSSRDSLIFPYCTRFSDVPIRLPHTNFQAYVNKCDRSDSF